MDVNEHGRLSNNTRGHIKVKKKQRALLLYDRLWNMMVVIILSPFLQLYPPPLTVSPLTSHSVFYFTFDIITTIRINSYLDNQYEDQGHNKGYQVRL